ncbi:MAG: hypothetical protein WA056_13955 [Gallionella sp.]
MTRELWSKMPCTWQTDANFHGAQLNSFPLDFLPPGVAIAALKLYIALCLKANFKSGSYLPDTGCSQKSISQLCELVGLSRPMTIKGLRKLQEWKIVTVKGGRPVIYHITDYETAKYWVKLPRTHLYAGSKEKRIERLRVMSNRSKTTLHALQMYLYLAAIRDKSSGLAKVTYERLSEVLGITRNDISKAISALVGFDLISVRLAEFGESSGKHPSNIYWLRGSQVGRKMDGAS